MRRGDAIREGGIRIDERMREIRGGKMIECVTRNTT
jgi:hypothetical protein